MISKIYSFMPRLIYFAILILAIGLFLSTIIMSGFHVLILLPAIFLLNRKTITVLPASAWCLLALIISAVVSFVLNHDIMSQGYKVLFNFKFYILAVLAIIPLNFYFNEYLKGQEKLNRIKYIIHIALIIACLATIVGFLGYLFHYNPFNPYDMMINRNIGVFSFALDYAHQVAFICALLAPVLIYYKKYEEWISLEFLIFSLVILLAGLVTTYTRGALIAFFAGLILVHRKIALIICIAFGIGVTSISLINPDLIEKLFIKKSSNVERVSSWKGAWAAFKEKPIIGYGPYNFESHSKEIKKRNHVVDENFESHAQNNFLEILATLGILGFIPFMCWLLLWGLEIVRLEQSYANIILPFVLTFILGGFTHMTINSDTSAFFIFFIYSITAILPKRIRYT